VALVGLPVVIETPDEGPPRVHDLSYPAHMAGILRGMPVATARRLCPDLRVLPARPQDYQGAFEAMLEALGEISPEVEPADLEHGWLSARGLLPEGGREDALAKEVARSVRHATGLNVRVGLAHGKLTSRILTDYLARRDVMVLPAGKEVVFLGGLSMRYMPLAPSVLERLHGLGVTRVRQYAQLPRRGILPRFGHVGLRAYQLAHGQDDSNVRPWADEPLLEAEHIFPEPIANLRSLQHHLERLSARLAPPLARQYRMASRMRLSVTFEDGRQVEKRRDLIVPVASARGLLTHAEALAQEVEWGQSVERVSLSVRGLCPTIGRQLALFRHGEESREGVERTLQRIQGRYGENVVQKGLRMEPDSPLHERRGKLIPWPVAG